MSSDAYDFDEQLNFGTDWETFVEDRLKEILTSVNVQSVSFDQNPDIQRSGIDTILAKSEPTIDVKTQRHDHVKSDNLPIEVVAVMHEPKPGWFYSSEADMIVWVYPNKAETNLHHVGYFMPLSDGLREWFNDNHQRFRFVRIPNKGRYGEYNTGCRLVPIEEFPDEYLVEFDPRLPTERETPQSDITNWL